MSFRVSYSFCETGGASLTSEAWSLEHKLGDTFFNNGFCTCSLITLNLLVGSMLWLLEHAVENGQPRVGLATEHLKIILSFPSDSWIFAESLQMENVSHVMNCLSHTQKESMHVEVWVHHQGENILTIMKMQIFITSE
jgi:hypothetical protein